MDIPVVLIAIAAVPLLALAIGIARVVADSYADAQRWETRAHRAPRAWEELREEEGDDDADPWAGSIERGRRPRS